VRDAIYSDVLAAERTLKTKHPFNMDGIVRHPASHAAMITVLEDGGFVRVAEAVYVLLVMPPYRVGRWLSVQGTLSISPMMERRYNINIKYAMDWDANRSEE
jgi:hypothetical protein